MSKHHYDKTRPLVHSGIAMAIALAPFAAAQAYVGPGAGLSLLGALWGVIAAVGAALLFVIVWPIRRMRRRKAAEKNAHAQQTGHAGAGSDEGSPHSQ